MANGNLKAGRFGLLNKKAGKVIKMTSKKSKILAIALCAGVMSGIYAPSLTYALPLVPERDVVYDNEQTKTESGIVINDPNIKHPEVGDHTDECGEKVYDTDMTIGDLNEVVDDLVENDTTIAEKVDEINKKVNNIQQTTDTDTHVAAGEYSIDKETGNVTMDIVDKNGGDTGKDVVIKDVASKTELDTAKTDIDALEASDEAQDSAITGLQQSDAAQNQAITNIYDVTGVETTTELKDVYADTNYISGANNMAEADVILDREISNVNTRVDGLENRVDGLEDRIDKVGAMSAAIANLRSMGYDPAAPTEIAVGVGQYRDETGAALGLFHYPNRDFMLSLSVSTSGDEVMGGIGATWKFGRKSPEKVAEIKKAQAEADIRRAEEAKLAKAEEMKKAAREAKVQAQMERHGKLAAERAAQAEA